MADYKPIRGTTVGQEIREEHIVRDTRGITTKLFHWLTIPNNLVTVLIVFAAVAFLFPEVGDFSLVIAGLFCWFGLTRKETAPLKLPVQAAMSDHNERNPSNGKAMSANGIFFLGNELKTGKEVWLTNSDCRQHFLVLGTTGAGKALPLDALVHTPTGWKTMGELKVGDRVSTPDGRSSKIVGYFPQGELDIYKFTFSDGRTAEACPEHLWEVFQADGEDPFVAPRLMRTKEIAELLRSSKNNLSVRLSDPIEKPRSTVSVDSYVFGSELADDFIPLAYQESSIEQRWGLVQGLMDVRGEADGRTLSFSTTSERLANDFRNVVWSLGGLGELLAKQKDELGSAFQGQISYEVIISHSTPQKFFRHSDKIDLIDNPYQDAHFELGIVAVEPVRRAEAACILIDHPDHLFVTNNYVVTHNTEALLGFAANAIAWGSGFLFCDGKGDVALFAKVYALARRFGREDDLLVLNYMTGNQDLGASGGRLRSNTLNPFATGSSDTLTQMVVGLMDDAGGDGAMWKGRATAMFTGVMRALAWLRDQQIIDLNVSEIRDHLNLKRIIDLADVAKYPDLPQSIRKSIKSYLTSLPGFQEDKGHKQSQTTLDQHGYLEMQFTKILGSLADVYGHIFHTPYGEIDMADVVLNRRILVIMLPALEKSGDEIANLGKIVVATLKGMMGGTLGSQIEGTWDTVVENRPTVSPSPFIVVLDEVGYYMVDGMDLMSAQARSLGFSMIFAGQDINAMKRLNDKVFGSVQGNTNTKIIMRTEDPETAKLAVEAGGKAWRAHVGSYEGEAKEVGGRAYSDKMEAKLEAVDRINPLDLKAQDEGEMHIIHKDWLVRAKSFYANPENSVNRKNLVLRANHFITVAKPDAEDIESQQRLPEIVMRLADADFARQMKTEAANAIANMTDTAEIGSIVKTLAQVEASKRRQSSPVEAACIAFAKLCAEMRSVNEKYAKEVQTATSGRGARMPQNEDDNGRQAVNPRQERLRQRPEEFHPGQFDGFPEEGPIHYDEHRRPNSGQPFLPDEFAAPPARPPAAPQARPFTGGKVRKNVDHGVQIENGEVHDFADRLLSQNDGIMRSLSALNFDEKVETRQSVDNALEEALMPAGDYDDGDLGPFDHADVDRATNATSTALPDFEDEEEEGGEQGGGLAVNDFLGALLDPDGDE